MFAHKLCAITDRKKLQNRDLYDSWFMFEKGFEINEEIINEETRLMRLLLNEKTYLKKVRPSHQVTVDIRLVFNQIVSMVEKEQIIVTNCFVDQKWTG